MLYMYRVNNDGSVSIYSASGLTASEIAGWQQDGFTTYWTTTRAAGADGRALAAKEA